MYPYCTSGENIFRRIIDNHHFDPSLEPNTSTPTFQRTAQIVDSIYPQYFRFRFLIFLFVVCCDFIVVRCQ